LRVYTVLPRARHPVKPPILRIIATECALLPKIARALRAGLGGIGMGKGLILSQRTHFLMASAAIQPPSSFWCARNWAKTSAGARAMLNFGLTEMRLVTPRDGWPNPSAGPAAAGADQVLEGAAVFGTLAEAVADCAHVYATTVRKRGTRSRADARGRHARSMGCRGARRSCSGRNVPGWKPTMWRWRAIITVPINPEFASLNLAQAVILCAYEWSKGAAQTLEQPPWRTCCPLPRRRNWKG
jgi:hypothetical protein